MQSLSMATRPFDFIGGSIAREYRTWKRDRIAHGFNAAHSKAANGVDEADAFLSKQAYLDLYSDVRQASAAALDTATTAELDEDAPETFRAFCPTVLDMYVLIAAHPMMHAGQFAVVRRQLGKPVLM